MSRAMKYNIVQTATWTLVAIIMAVIFFSGNTISEWGDNRFKTILLAVSLFIGFGIDFIIRRLEISSKYKVIKDERYIGIQNKALGFAFVIVVTYVYILSIGLYVYYEDVGLLPVGWIWFIAYSLIVVANLTVGYSSLYFFGKQGL